MFPYGGHHAVVEEETWICCYNPVSKSAQIFLALLTSKDLMEIRYYSFEPPSFDDLVAMLQRWGGMRIGLDKWYLSLDDHELERYTLLHKGLRFIMRPLPDRAIETIEIPKLLL